MSTETEKDCELETIEQPETEAVAEQAAPEAPVAPAAPAIPQIPAAQRIETLFKDCFRQKSLLVAILEFCREERTTGEINDMLAPLQEHNHSVYTPSTLRNLLQRAGALEKIVYEEEAEKTGDEDVQAPVEPAEAVECAEAPETPEVAEPVEGREPTWLTTAEGLEYIESLDPFGDLAAVIDEYSEHTAVFAEILETCRAEGVKLADIESAVRKLGIKAANKLTAGFFIAKLEDFGAIEWRGAWTTTDLGVQYLEYLAQQQEG